MSEFEELWAEERMLSRTLGDREGLPGYLETLEEKNVRLYEHFAFKVVDESFVPGIVLTDWAMVRRGPTD